MLCKVFAAIGVSDAVNSVSLEHSVKSIVAGVGLAWRAASLTCRQRAPRPAGCGFHFSNPQLSSSHDSNRQLSSSLRQGFSLGRDAVRTLASSQTTA